MRYRFLSCVTPPQWFHTSGRYTVLFSVRGKKAREETKTVNLLSKKKKKKKPWKMERRRAAKANVSRSVVFGRRAEGERDNLPLRLSLSPPPLSCLTSSTVFISSFPLLHPLWTRGRQRPLAAGSPVQRRCEPSNRLSLPSGTSHTPTQLKAAMSSLLASVNHSHINLDALV